MRRDPDSRLVDAFVERAQHGVGLVSEDILEAGWRRLEEPLGHAPSAHGVVTPEPRRWLRAWVAGFATASALAVLSLGIYRLVPQARPTSLHYTVEGTVLHEGHAITATQVGSHVLFSDDSRIDLGQRAQMKMGAIHARGAEIRLVDGAIDVYVKPSAHGDWLFRAGPFRVHVKGTAFHMDFSANRGRLDLHMSSGLVEVHAPPDRVLRVAAGDSVELYAEPRDSIPGQATSPERADDGEASPASAPVAAQPPEAAPQVPSAPTTILPAAPTPSRKEPAPAPDRHRSTALAKPAREAPIAGPVSWPRLLTKGRFGQVVDEAQARGIPATLAGADAADLSALADAARYTKRFDLARQALLAVRSRFAGGEHARDASFFLGRLGEAAHDPSTSALGWYEAYLRESPRGLYASEALGRKMTLLLPIDRTRAGQAARQYLERFPRGPQAELAHSLLGTGAE